MQVMDCTTFFPAGCLFKCCGWKEKPCICHRWEWGHVSASSSDSCYWCFGFSGRPSLFWWFWQSCIGLCHACIWIWTPLRCMWASSVEWNVWFDFQGNWHDGVSSMDLVGGALVRQEASWRLAASPWDCEKSTLFGARDFILKLLPCGGTYNVGKTTRATVVFLRKIKTASSGVGLTNIWTQCGNRNAERRWRRCTLWTLCARIRRGTGWTGGGRPGARGVEIRRRAASDVCFAGLVL